MLVFELNEDLTVTKWNEFCKGGRTRLGEPIPWQQEYIRQFVVQHMSPSGSVSYLLSVDQFQKIYLLADGMGKIDYDFAVRIGFDWSHVRDASPEAYVAMGNAIIATVYPHHPSKEISAFATSLLTAAMHENIDPLSLLPFND